ncbi:MAG: hypothetical protein P4M08_10070 [Oligoflexia bacterium]|nr:hypothetical protein [Oligoflexia bacterium]
MQKFHANRGGLPFVLAVAIWGTFSAAWCEKAQAVTSVAYGKACPVGSSCTYSQAKIDSIPLKMSCSSGVMSVSSVTYGYGSKTESCVSYVSGACNGASSCTITFDPANCGGDPDPGVSKTGSVALSCEPASAYAQKDLTTNSAAASSAISGWPVTNLYDNNLGTDWSSSFHSTASSEEWFAFWWSQGMQPTNYVKLFPRYNGSVALSFPVNFTVYYSNGSAWVPAATYTNYPVPANGNWIILPLPATYNANGIQIVATTLGEDNQGGYYFQLAEAKAGYAPAFNQTLVNGKALACMVGDGVTSNDTCLSQALASCPAQCSIQFGSGNFLFSSGKTYSFLNDVDRSLSISGQGIEATNLIFNGSSGFNINFAANASDSAHFSNLSISQAGSGVGTGIALNGTGALQRDPSTFDNVHLSAQQATGGGWATGVSLSGVSFVNFNGFIFEARNSTVGTGISLTGDLTGNIYGIQYQIANSFFEGGNIGLVYGNYIQGVEIENTAFQNVNTAIEVTASGAQLSVSNSRLSTLSDGIVFQKIFTQFFYSNNVQYVLDGASAIKLLAPISGTIDDSDIVGPGNGAGAVGINAAPSVQALQVTVTGNNISGFNTGVLLGSGSAGYTVYNNIFSGDGASIINLGGSGNLTAAPSSVALPQCESQGQVCQNGVLAASSAVPIDVITVPGSVYLPSNVMLASSYGCVGDGKTLNDSCLNTMLATCPINCSIEFGAGVYLFSSAKTFSFPSDVSRSLSIYGQGQGTTKLEFNGTNGLVFNYSTRVSDSLNLTGLSVIQLAANSGTGITLNGVGNMEGAPSVLNDISVLAQQITNGGWSTAVQVIGVSNLDFTGLAVFPPNSSIGNGVTLQGSSAAPISQIQFLNSIFQNGNIDIQYGSYVNNVSVINSEFTNSDTAVYVNGAGASGLTIANSQIDTASFGIVIQSPLTGFMYSNNLQYVHNNPNSGTTGIYLLAAVAGKILDSDIGGPGNGQGSFGIYAAASASSLAITGNRLGGFNAAIDLSQGTSGYSVFDNSYTGTGVGISGLPSNSFNVVNQGSNSVQ